jgi:5-methyltetrahydrofolate--homocysteine methyltransferase
MWDAMQIQERSGIELTEHLAMVPAASVSALVFASPMAKYFAVGKIGKDQIKDYAARRGATFEETEKSLSQCLNYDDDA